MQTAVHEVSKLIEKAAVMQICSDELTGSLSPCISPMSRNLPSITIALAPKYLLLAAIRPPKQAEYIPLGCCIYMILPCSFASAKCFSDLGLDLSDASTI